MRLINRLIKPEYVYSPNLLLRRVFGRKSVPAFVDAILPWGLPIRVCSQDNIGSQVIRLGVFDLPVCETLWRLADAGETAVDIGANIGCIAAVLAARLRSTGRLICIEPHPVLARELCENVGRWTRAASMGVATADVRAVGLSSQNGVLPLHVPSDFQHNRGQCSFETSLIGDVQRADADISVPVTTLDELFAADETIGLIKVDVEGHELAVLHGGARLFEQKRVRDVIFEEHGDWPTPASTWLASRGYSIFSIARSMFGPKLLRPDSAAARSFWEAPSLLATTERDRALRRLGPRGWQCLRPRN